MHLGRHRAEPPPRTAGSSSASGIGLWGGFTTVVTGITLGLFGVGVFGTLFFTAVLGSGFALAWWLGRVGILPAPALPTDADVAADATAFPPAGPIGPVGVRSAVDPAATTTFPHAVEPDSRWIDTFGPPETGQLPVQRYVPPGSSSDDRPVPSARAFPQWSHSRA